MATYSAEHIHVLSKEAIEFKNLIEQAYNDGYACHGDLRLDQKKFVLHLLWVVKKYVGSDLPSSAAIDFVAGLHVKDLYLAVACAHNSERAWRLFITIYQKHIVDLSYFLSPNPGAARELADNVLVDLFLPDRVGNSRIASYAGRSSLATWLRVIVTHRAINERDSKHNMLEHIECIPEIADAHSLKRIEAELRADRYEHIIKDCFEHACQSLTDNERLVLLLRYEQELQLSQIGRLLGIHTSTVARRLGQVQRKLRGEVMSVFACKYSFDQAAIEECLVDISENPSHSILALIKQNQREGRAP